MLRLITDFDGPLMDVSGRYYHVYQVCLEKIGGNRGGIRQLSKSEFWQLKRNRVPEAEIGRISGLEEQEAQSFAKMRLETVHDLCYFQYDTIIPNSLDALLKAQKMGMDLVLMTMRRHKELERAFQKHSLDRFFAPERRYYLADDFIKTTDVQDKPLLMDKAQKELSPLQHTWMVGDTEADIAAAKKHNIPVIGVLSGIRSQEQLEKYQPDHIVENLSLAVDLITELL
jgi:phosphoglycolate phosphatase-like HAD superfamily hydrolase